MIYFRLSTNWLAWFLIACINISAQQPAQIPTDKPALIVGLVLDQMRPDQINQYWDKFGDGGFRKLMNHGSVMTQAAYRYYNTQHAPGIATIVTGAQPAVHGVVSNDWFELLREDMIHCTSDETAMAIGGSFENGQYSPKNMLVSTIGDELKLSSRSQSRVFGIGMRHEAAILSAGHSADAAYWFDTESGQWMSSSHYLDSLPQWLRTFNEKALPDMYLERRWEPLYPIGDHDARLPDTLQTRYPLGGFTGFPYDLNKISRIDRNTKNYHILQYTPFANTLTMDLALSMLFEEQLGEDDTPDLLMVNVGGLGIAASQFGSESVEFEDVLLRLDQDLAHFIETVEQKVGKHRVLFFMTATHGMHSEQKYKAALKLPGGQFDRNQALALLKSYLNVKYGQGDWVKGYYGNSIFLNRQLIEDSEIPLSEMQSMVANFLVQFAAVAETITSTALSNGEFSKNVRGLVQNGYHPKRSGDIIVILRSGWTLDNPIRTGTGYNYDRKIPLVWYGWKIGKRSIYRDLDMTDVAATLSFFLDIPPPDAASGSPILELVE